MKLVYTSRAKLFVASYVSSKWSFVDIVGDIGNGIVEGERNNNLNISSITQDIARAASGARHY